jgi:hypothetical protein
MIATLAKNFTVSWKSSAIGVAIVLILIVLPIWVPIDDELQKILLAILAGLGFAVTRDGDKSTEEHKRGK